MNTCPQNNKFEGKERDTETNNDDFGARYYSSRFGRWLSADWSSVPAPVPYANLTNPQTLNLYAMVSDDPESFADLDGHMGVDPQVSTNGADAFWGFSDTDFVTDGVSTVTSYSLTGSDLMAYLKRTLNTWTTNGGEPQSAQNRGTISLTLGKTQVTGEYYFGEIDMFDGSLHFGAVVDATADCTSCFWVQTIASTGSKQKTDAPLGKDSPLMVTMFAFGGHYSDTPSRPNGSAGASDFVAMLGKVDLSHKTFKATGAMTYGYSVDRQGNVTGRAPALATRHELRQALAVVNSEYPAGKIK